MINESYHGLPVISFKIGLAQDVINTKNGFLASELPSFISKSNF